MLTTREFIDDYLTQNRPVVISGAPEWHHINQNWTPEMFATRFGDRKITIRSGGKRYQILLRDYLGYAAQIPSARQVGIQSEILYMHSILIGRAFPELLEEFTVPAYFRPNWLARWPLKSVLADNFCREAQSSAVLFIGPPGANIGLVHRDRYLTHAWIHQVYGVKRLWIASPEQTPYLYPHPERPIESLVPALGKPDVEKYPLLAKASIAIIDLQPGETILVPSGWWHYASCLTLSISVSGNFVNGTNYARFAADVPAEQVAAFPWLKDMQKWMIMRAHGAICSCVDMVNRHAQVMSPEDA